MNEDTQIIDQSGLAEAVASKVKYTFQDLFLVKPLDPIKVTKEFTKPVAKNTEKVDGLEVQNYDEVETEVKEVDSDYRKGVVIKVPVSYEKQKADIEASKWLQLDINVGDIIIYREGAARPFDLLKDSVLLRMYDITAIENGNDK